jgi:hypothetical protein
MCDAEATNMRAIHAGEARRSQMRGVEASTVRASQTASAADASAVETAKVRAVNPSCAAADATKLCATEPGPSTVDVCTTTAATKMASAVTARRGKLSWQKCDGAERKTCRENFEGLVRHNAHSPSKQSTKSNPLYNRKLDVGQPFRLPNPDGPDAFRGSREGKELHQKAFFGRSAKVRSLTMTPQEAHYL